MKKNMKNVSWQNKIEISDLWTSFFYLPMFPLELIDKIWTVVRGRMEVCACKISSNWDGLKCAFFDFFYQKVSKNQFLKKTFLFGRRLFSMQSNESMSRLWVSLGRSGSIQVDWNIMQQIRVTSSQYEYYFHFRRKFVIDSAFFWWPCEGNGTFMRDREIHSPCTMHHITKLIFQETHYSKSMVLNILLD